ncbi:hypothetical protein MLD38_024808 [Melastoma candidum]|uniref:Uncharacterized protein n=2 Tax=Melastoma candidum TaxID=119954 RepID=A0ACB9NUE1_9MYRT|nr:hypothetical protein MLD38_024800 [Melastoma candidum]KAI4339923.1 hypothetical protein MLD38_024808 [Melastoma candidum]
MLPHFQDQIMRTVPHPSIDSPATSDCPQNVLNASSTDDLMFWIGTLPLAVFFTSIAICNEWPGYRSYSVVCRSGIPADTIGGNITGLYQKLTACYGIIGCTSI